MQLANYLESQQEIQPRHTRAYTMAIDRLIRPFLIGTTQPAHTKPYYRRNGCSGRRLWYVGSKATATQLPDA